MEISYFIKNNIDKCQKNVNIIKRPAVLCCMFLIAGIITADITKSFFICLMSTFILAVFLYLPVKRGSIKLYTACLLVLFFLAGGYGINRAYLNSKNMFRDFSGKKVTIEGYAADAVTYKNKKAVFILKTENIKTGSKTYKISGRILITADINDCKELKYGRGITVEGIINLPEGKRNPGGFDYSLFLRQQKIYANIYAYKGNLKLKDGYKGGFVKKAGLIMRDSIINTMNECLLEQQAGLICAMLTGYRENLDDETEEAFSISGLTHIMAVTMIKFCKT